MFYFSVLLSLFINAQSQPDQVNFDWLIGIWAGVDNTEAEQSFEIWEKLGKGVYEGIGYTIKDGDTTFIEQLSIADIYGVMHYTAKVPNNDGPVSFGMVKTQEMGFICANAENDFPKVIEYNFEDNVLNATISGDGKSKTFSFIKQ